MIQQIELNIENVSFTSDNYYIIALGSIIIILFNCNFSFTVCRNIIYSRKGITQ